MLRSLVGSEMCIRDRSTGYDDGGMMERLYGAHPVGAALLHKCRSSFNRLLLQGGHEDLARRAADAGIPVERTSKHQLDVLSNHRPHQGVLLECAPLQPALLNPSNIGSMAERSEPQLIVALDELHDPQNLGAILRSVAWFGVDLCVMSQKNSAPLSPAVSKASAGAVETLVAEGKLQFLPRSTNMVKMLTTAADSGFRVMGTAVGGAGVTCASSVERDAHTVAVFGNEGVGSVSYTHLTLPTKRIV
eukprot:TRINITY_DN30341_c0_g1_i1.p2 TRINITY_DN30341_c0_g1~~TRINITY_DN30341_c0_g1_i1.p2  ORF type:complete len:247 (-),score=60.80 TRINITY_DN30341_c0_g1_i1:124-864(-)